MAEKRDYYDILGVSRDASDDQIKSAYRKLAKQYHPDLNHAPDAAEKFKEVTEAYEVPSDSNKRRQYDQFGRAAFDNNGQGGFSGFSGSGMNGGFDFDDLGDIFSQFFGGGRSSRGDNLPRKGADTLVNVTLTFDQAVHGCKVDIPLNHVRNCDECHGTGALHGTDFKKCPTCNGTGRVLTRRQTILGTMQTESVCPDCHGSGKIIVNKCTKCHGSGKVQSNETLTVNIPAGVDTGSQIRIQDKGKAGENGGPNGDLIIRITALESKIFKRDKENVSIDCPISFIDAILGCTVTVPTINGDCDLVIPQSCQPNTILKMTGKGIPSLKGQKSGDQFVNVIVKFPKKLTATQEELLKKFQEEEDKKGNSIFDIFKGKRKKK